LRTSRRLRPDPVEGVHHDGVAGPGVAEESVEAVAVDGGAETSDRSSRKRAFSGRGCSDPRRYFKPVRFLQCPVSCDLLSVSLELGGFAAGLM
jgi:hypothetical protein